MPVPEMLGPDCSIQREKDQKRKEGGSCVKKKTSGGEQYESF